MRETDIRGGGGRIATKFAELRARNEKALITYAMTGFPSEKKSVSAIRGMIRGGADIIEMGFPFSDPLADGTAIQEASARSLRGGATFEGFLRTAKGVRCGGGGGGGGGNDTPLVLMTYTNILYNIGYDKAAARIADAGIDGLILPDMSAEESASYVRAARRHGLDTIFLVSPNTSESRLQKIIGLSSGFLYVVAVYGTTGVRSKKSSTGGAVADYAIDAVYRVGRHARRSGLPVGVGFGVSTPADVRAYVEAGADAVVVGSAYTRIIKEAEAGSIEARVAEFTASLKGSTRPARRARP